MILQTNEGFVLHVNKFGDASVHTPKGLQKGAEINLLLVCQLHEKAILKMTEVTL